jgi:hypothetical protein
MNSHDGPRPSRRPLPAPRAELLRVLMLHLERAERIGVVEQAEATGDDERLVIRATASIAFATSCLVLWAPKRGREGCVGCQRCSKASRHPLDRCSIHGRRGWHLDGVTVRRVPNVRATEAVEPVR